MTVQDLARHVESQVPPLLDVYGDKVLQLTWGEKPIAILIRSPQMAANYKEYWDAVWKRAKG